MPPEKVIRFACASDYPLRVFPLRTKDADFAVEPLIDQCHERGYHLLNYRLALNRPLPPQDAAWAEELLRESQCYEKRAASQCEESVM
jgi:hypothetical protein